MRKFSGFFITFESTAEGLGKTTQSRRLYERLTSEGYNVVLTHQPGGTEIGQTIREIVLNPKNDLSNAAELFLFLADRAQHYKEVVYPSLDSGKIVICDRYIDTTLVYQGRARGWNEAFIRQLHHTATGALLPDLTVVLDGETFREIPAEDRFERQGSSFHRKVKLGMLDLAKEDKRFAILNANEADETTTAHRIYELVQGRLSVAGL